MGTPPRQPSFKAIRLHSQNVGSSPSSSTVTSDGLWREGAAGQSRGVRKPCISLPAHYSEPLRGLPVGNTEKVRVLRDNICNSHPVLITRRVRCSLSSGSCEEQTHRIHTRSQLDLIWTHSASFSAPSDSPPSFPPKPAHLRRRATGLDTVYDEVNNKLGTSPYRTHADSWGWSREGAGKVGGLMGWARVCMTSPRPIQAFAEPRRDWLPAGAVGARGRAHRLCAPSLRSRVSRPRVEARPRLPPTARQAWAWHVSPARPPAPPHLLPPPSQGAGRGRGPEESCPRLGWAGRRRHKEDTDGPRDGSTAWGQIEPGAH